MIVFPEPESEIMEHPKGSPMVLLRNAALGQEFKIQTRLGYFVKKHPISVAYPCFDIQSVNDGVAGRLRNSDGRGRGLLAGWM